MTTSPEPVPEPTEPREPPESNSEDNWPNDPAAPNGPAAPGPDAAGPPNGPPTPGGPADTEEPDVVPVAELDELRDRWRRALADLDNLRKRQTKDLARERDSERARVATAWLPVVDNLELALSHTESGTESLIQGVNAVRNQAVDILDRLGYPRDDETGVPFDPARHEAVTVVEDPEAEPGTVVQCLRPGYGAPGRQLRPMAAVVSKRQE
ncbi:nucleotide exchange factor GrpE [Streptomyces sp. NBC_01716]|uniref:nucleotide exchange factor GrpE n=1 Tax=Streptomyces sp. NBC_01716 TaxID=2975917 RepID=UPI002E331687|nr:nucleotide exchange factor GrpE [Streptomyces sp. NBC_01716]